MNKVGVVGLGYIGLPLLASLASVGFDVMGIDIDENRLRKLIENNEPGFYEVGLNEALSQYRSHIAYTEKYSVLLGSCHTIIITIGTELLADGNPNMAGLVGCRTAIAPHLRKGHTIILKSTVPIGTTQKFADDLALESGLKAGEDFFVAYSPERTIEGQAIRELLSLPKIIGGVGQESVEKAKQVLGNLGGRVVVVKSPELAEMCKLVDNTFRSTGIAFGNEVGALCEALGLDSYDLVSAINDGYDRTSLFRSGLGAGGPCLSKDSTILALDAKRLGVPVEIIEAGIKGNKDATIRTAHFVEDFLHRRNNSSPRIALLGLAFKGNPETDDVRGSPASLIFDYLIREFPDSEFQLYDPIIQTFNGLPVSSDIAATLGGSDVAMFLTDHRTLLNIHSSIIVAATTKRPLLVIDCWHNIDDPKSLGMDGIEVIRIGDGTN